MNFTLGHSLRHSQRLTQSMQLNLSQRQMIKMYCFSLMLQLVAELRGERYQPKASCLNCGHDLTAEEILKGFRNDPRNYTTECPKCQERFNPQLICFGEGSQIELPFFCELQALDLLRQYSNLSPAELLRKAPGVYRSAIIHAGSIREAFAKINIYYRHEEVPDWQTKVMPFLGRLTDLSIAKAAGVQYNDIRWLRRRHGIAGFSRRKTAEAAGAL